MTALRNLSLLFAVLLAAPSARANPYQPLVEFAGHAAPTSGSLELRDCSNPCGWQNQYCCGSSETCITTAGNIAVCTVGANAGAGAADGGWQLFTTTFVQVDSITVTSTGSYPVTAVQTPVAGGSPVPCSNGQSCGAQCCDSNQYCLTPGSCVPIGATGSAFIRPTSNTIMTATGTAASTTITPYGPTGAAATGAMNQGLSGGAIAGIVIGVLLGLVLLFFVLGCLCCKGIIDGILAALGIGRRRRREETTIIESRHSHHSGSRPPPPGRTWFGLVRPGRTEVVEEKRKKKSSGLGGLLGVGAVLTALAVLLGLKRRRDREREDKVSSYGSVSYYSYEDDYTTSASSASSDRRTRSHRGSRR